jgi:hypothetical protein
MHWPTVETDTLFIFLSSASLSRSPFQFLFPSSLSLSSQIRINAAGRQLGLRPMPKHAVMSMLSEASGSGSKRVATDRGGWMSSTLARCVGVMSLQERRLDRSLSSHHRHGGLMHKSGARHGSHSDLSRQGCCGALELGETTWRRKPRRSPRQVIRQPSAIVEVLFYFPFPFFLDPLFNFSIIIFFQNYVHNLLFLNLLFIIFAYPKFSPKFSFLKFSPKFHGSFL